MNENRTTATETAIRALPTEVEVMTRATVEPEATTAEKADEVTAETGATASETAAAIEATAVGRKTVE